LTVQDQVDLRETVGADVIGDAPRDPASFIGHSRSFVQPATLISPQARFERGTAHMASLYGYLRARQDRQPLVDCRLSAEESYPE
jgi:hypothetical protein